jgi:hypothetical protein
MSRSGTSAISGLLVAAGFHAGRDDEVLGASPHNARGHHENLALLRLNSALLEELGGSWLLPPDAGRQREHVAGALRVRCEVEELLGAADGAPVLVKDPRIGMLLALWGPIIDDLLHPVLVVRDPLEVARSLQERGETPLPLALAAWELHLREVLQFLDGRRVTVVAYTGVLEHPERPGQVVRWAAANLAAELRERIDPPPAGDAVDPALRHHRGRQEDRDLLSPAQRELWQWLAHLPEGDHRLVVPAEFMGADTLLRALVRTEMERADAAFDLRSVRAALQATNVELTAARTELATDRERADRATAERDAALRAADELRERLESLESQLRALESRYRVLVGSRSWRVTRPLRQARTRLSG